MSAQLADVEKIAEVIIVVQGIAHQQLVGNVEAGEVWRVALEATSLS